MPKATHSSKRTIGTAVLSVLAAIAVAALPAAAQPGRIVVDNTGPSILEFNTDGSNGFAIAGNTDNNAVFSPSVAANGNIAFTANTDVDGTYLGYQHIFLMNADGKVRNISSSLPSPPTNCCNGLSPAISPDGSTVAFLASLNAAPDGSLQQEIYLLNADGSNLRQLTPFMDNPNTNPPIGDYSQSAMYGLAWSPDSTKVAFRGSVYTSQCGTYGGQPIFVNVIGTINADGTGMQFLACDNGDGYVTSLDWSPDGTLLAWGRNVSHGAQGCSGCVGEPAIAFYDLSGQGRYMNGITSSQLTTDSCQGGAHCIHFSPDSSQLAYVDAYPNNGNPCQSACNVSFINLDGTGQSTSTIPTGGHGVWWEPGPAIPAPTQLTVAGPNGPASTLEVWPGFSQQVTPTLSDSNGNLILHTAQNYFRTNNYGTYGCLSMGPYGLAVFVYTDGLNAYGTIYATNAGLTSSPINYNCWQSSPCTFTLGSTYTNIPAGGGTGMVTVTADPGSNVSTCPWSATPSASWITITSGASGRGNGSVNFSAAANAGAARQATITIAGLTYTVNQDAVGSGASLTSITVTPNPASVAAGLTLQFTATGNYSDSSTKNLTASVTWTSSNNSLATISNAGLATGVLAGGPITITASINGVSGTAQLTVTAPVLQSIAVAPASASVAAGLTQPFSATGNYSDGSMKPLTASVTWTSSNNSIATISSAGLATGVAAGGPIAITATLNGISGTAQLTVIAPVLQSIAVAPASASVVAGLTQPFTATGNYSDGSTKPLTASVAWTSSNNSIATISSTGLATGMLAGGPVTIMATQSGINGTAQLTVTAPLLVSIIVRPVNSTTVVGTAQQFTATGRYTDGSRQNITGSVTWASSNTSVATINATGLASALATGSTTISASQGGISNSTSMTVIKLVSVSMSPLSPSIFVGGTQQFALSGTYSDGSTRDLTSSAVWSSSKSSVAAITSPGGLATGVANGATTIGAAAGGLSASTTLTVNKVFLQTIVINPASATIAAGGSQQFTATGYYNNGAVQNLTGVVSWSLAPSKLGAISSTGLATAPAPSAGYNPPSGTATVLAKYAGVTATATLIVQ